MPTQKFTSETAPKGKGRGKSKQTKVREAIGLTAWEGLKDWAEGAGIERCISEIEKLKGQNYVYAYATILEYVKPKLNRIALETDPNLPLIPKVIKIEIVPAKTTD